MNTYLAHVNTAKLVQTKEGWQKDYYTWDDPVSWFSTKVTDLATIPSERVGFLPDLATDTALLWQLPDRNNINNQMNCKRQFVPAAEFHAWFENYPLLWNQMQHKVLQCCLANYWSSAYGYLPGERNLSILYQTDWTRPKVCLHPEVVRNSIVFMVWIDKVTTYWV